MKRFKKRRSYEQWTQACIDAFLKVADDRATLALHLLLYMGQRRGDVAKMTWHDYDGNRITVVQQKTGAKLQIPCHRALRAVLDATERAGVTMLTSPRGAAYSSKHLGNWFSKVMDKAGLRKERELTLHGLRASAAGRLAEAGATDMEVMAITGYRTIRMVQHYTRGARQKVLGLQAIQKLEDQS